MSPSLMTTEWTKPQSPADTSWPAQAHVSAACSCLQQGDGHESSSAGHPATNKERGNERLALFIPKFSPREATLPAEVRWERGVESGLGIWNSECHSKGKNTLGTAKKGLLYPS